LIERGGSTEGWYGGSSKLEESKPTGGTITIRSHLIEVSGSSKLGMEVQP
jgi:hypothetical protein